MVLNQLLLKSLDDNNFQGFLKMLYYLLYYIILIL
jgi:hypothetical protein